LILTILQIFLSQAIGMGLGQAMLFLPSISVISHHVKARRVMATGIAVSVCPSTALLKSHLTLKSLNPDGDFLGCFCGRNCLANDLKPGQSEIGLPKRDPNICSYPWRFPSYGKFSLLCCMFRMQNCSRRCPP